MLHCNWSRPSVLGAALVCCALVMVAMGLPGCGSDAQQASGPYIAQPAGEDVCILAGEIPPEKVGAPDAAPPDLTEKVPLTVDDPNWHDDSVPIGSWERHSFPVKAGNYYAVELCPIVSYLHDPDLAISRDPDPYNNSWLSSSWGAHSDLVVFKAGTTGVMYVAVYGYNGAAGGNCRYGISVRLCHFGQNTG